MLLTHFPDDEPNRPIKIYRNTIESNDGRCGWLKGMFYHNDDSTIVTRNNLENLLDTMIKPEKGGITRNTSPGCRVFHRDRGYGGERGGNRGID